MPANCGWFLLTGESCPDQTSHNAFEHTKDYGTAFFRHHNHPRGRATVDSGRVIQAFELPGEEEGYYFLVHEDKAHHHFRKTHFSGDRVPRAYLCRLVQAPLFQYHIYLIPDVQHSKYAVAFAFQEGLCHFVIFQ